MIKQTFDKIDYPAAAKYASNDILLGRKITIERFSNNERHYTDSITSWGLWTSTFDHYSTYKLQQQEDQQEDQMPEKINKKWRYC